MHLAEEGAGIKKNLIILCEPSPECPFSCRDGSCRIAGPWRGGTLILEAELQLAAGGSIVWASVLVVGDKRGLASWWSLLDSRALCRL